MYFELLDGCAERGKCKARKLEALFAEGDTDNGDAPDNTRHAEAERKEQPAEYYPDNVCNGMRAEILIYRGAERPERNPCQLERLLAEGNTDNGDAPNDSGKEPRNSRPQSGKQEPQNVAECLHIFSPLMLI